MSQQLISRNADLAKLRNDGYEVQIRGSYLLITNVPYVTSSKEVAQGTIVSDLNLAGQDTVKPSSHVVSFVGSAPCKIDGSRLTAIEHAEGNQTLANGLVVNRTFSNKPDGGYVDYHHKMTRYIEMISGPAMALDTNATPRTFKVVESSEEESIFCYWDTNSSKARINVVSDKLKGFKVGIVGLGGTGSYILDLVAKTPVAEIHLFDGDRFLQHNAFRAPGAPTIDRLKDKPSKVDYLGDIYSRMHRGIRPHFEFLDSTLLGQLDSLDFVFICLDRGAVKKEIVSHLESHSIGFIDVGIGVNVVDDKLLATVRTTTSTISKRDHVAKRVPFTDGAENDYVTNIQVADLNMLNAALAVIKWKKLLGFYHDLEHENNSTYTLDGNKLLSEDPDT